MNIYKNVLRPNISKLYINIMLAKEIFILKRYPIIEKGNG